MTIEVCRYSSAGDPCRPNGCARSSKACGEREITTPEFRCSDCGKRCVDANALWQHRKFKHKAKTADNPHPRPRDDEISYADIAIEAQRKQRAGEPLEDWEKPYAY